MRSPTLKRAKLALLKQEVDDDDYYDEEVASKVSKPESKCTIGVHDLLINEDQWGVPLVAREGKYLGLKDDAATAGGVQFDQREAYPLDEYFTRAFIYAC